MRCAVVVCHIEKVLCERVHLVIELRLQLVVEVTIFKLLVQLLGVELSQHEELCLQLLKLQRLHFTQHFFDELERKVLQHVGNAF